MLTCMEFVMCAFYHEPKAVDSFVSIKKTLVVLWHLPGITRFF